MKEDVETPGKWNLPKTCVFCFFLSCLLSLSCQQARVCQVGHHQLTPFLHVRSAPARARVVKWAPGCCAHPKPAKAAGAKLVAQKRTNMEMAKRLRQKLHCFCSLGTENFFSPWHFKPIRKLIFYKAIRSILHSVCICQHGSFPSVGSWEIAAPFS